MRCVACGVRCVAHHWLCAEHRRAAAAPMRQMHVTESDFLRELVFKFPESVCARAEFVARFRFVALVWQCRPRTRRRLLLRIYGLVGKTRIAMGVPRDELVDLACALVAFWCAHLPAHPALAPACVERVTSWYAELAATEMHTMMRAERMVRALRTALGDPTILLFCELAVALLPVVPIDVVLRVYQAYLRAHVSVDPAA